MQFVKTMQFNNTNLMQFKNDAQYDSTIATRYYNGNRSNDTANRCNSTWLDNQSERLSSIPNLKDSAQSTRVTQLNNQPVRLSPTKYKRD